MLSYIEYGMQKKKPPGQRPSQDTLKDSKGPESGGSPSGTRIGRGPERPYPRGRTMMRGVSLAVEPLAGKHEGTAVQGRDELDDKGKLEERYRIIEEIGEGGMGTVYRGEWIKHVGGKLVPKKVAIKVLKFDEEKMRPDIEAQVLEELKNNHEQVDEEKLNELVEERIEWTRRDMNNRFITECQATANLGHTNIIGIIDVGEGKVDLEKGIIYVGGDVDEKDLKLFYVMEYLEGTELEKKMEKEGPIPWNQARFLMWQTCKALEAAHRNEDDIGDPNPIIHLDIKPANIFVITESGGTEMVKVLDFGIAKMVAPTVKDPTHGGGLVGTPWYMAPEQAFGGTIDNRTDIYSVGSTFYHVLTGCTVFYGNNNTELITKLIGEKPVPLTERRPELNIPEEAERIMMKCIEKDPAKRYQSMGQLREDIEGRTGGMNTMDIARLQSGEGWHPNSIPPGAGTQKVEAPSSMTMKDGEIISAARKRRKIKGAAVAVVSLAIVGTVAGVFLTRGPERNERERRPAVVAVPTSPMTEPIRRDAGTVMAAPKIDAGVVRKKKRKITFRTKLKGVKVFSGKKLLCTTGSDGTCDITIKKGKSLKVTFRRKGYKNTNMTVFKDTSGSVPVTLKRKPKRKRRRRRNGPRITSEGG